MTLKLVFILLSLIFIIIVVTFVFNFPGPVMLDEFVDWLKVKNK